MTFKKFILRFLIAFIVIAVSFILLNYKLNEFGLFGDTSNREYRIYLDEKTTKYLFSYNYIPKNFDGILVGPSLSDQMMDTRKIKKHKIYNLSMNGANITELKYAIDNVLKYGNIKTLILCIDPYITKDSGLKSSQINNKEYYSTLGSIFSIKHMYYKYFKDNENSKFHDSYWGYINNSLDKKDINSTEEINKVLQKINDDNFSSLFVDNIAYSELKSVINSIERKEIELLVYHYPIPYKILNHPEYFGHYRKYRNKIDKLLKNIYLIDFNTDEYKYISDNDTSYSDKGHLSKIGAEKVINVLNQSLNKGKK